jgi:hypothetical protein
VKWVTSRVAPERAALQEFYVATASIRKFSLKFTNETSRDQADHQRSAMSGSVRIGLRALFVAGVLAASVVPVTLSSATTSATPPTASQLALQIAASTKITTADASVLAEIYQGVGVTGGPVSGYPIPSDCFKLTDCVFGDTTSSKIVFLYGDSHARMWLPALNPTMIAHHLKLVLIGHDGCPVPTINLTLAKYAGCNQIRVNALKLIAATKPKMVLVANRTVTAGYSSSVWQAGMTKTLKTLKATHAVIIMMGDVQLFDSPPPTCIATYPTNVQNCSIANPNPKQPGLEKAEMAAAKAAGVTYLNTDPWLCTSTRCSPIVGDVVTHFDDGHISTDYAQYLSTVMAEAIEKYVSKF